MRGLRKANEFYQDTVTRIKQDMVPFEDGPGGGCFYVVSLVFGVNPRVSSENDSIFPLTNKVCTVFVVESARGENAWKRTLDAVRDELNEPAALNSMKASTYLGLGLEHEEFLIEPFEAGPSVTIFGTDLAIRAELVTEDSPNRRLLVYRKDPTITGRRGGRKRAEALSPRKRRAIARAAANARWESKK